MQRRILQTAIAFSVALGAAAAPASAADRLPKDTRPVLALLAVNAGSGFATEDVVSVESLLLNALEETGRFHVIGHSDIVTLLDLEVKKQAAGCTGDDTACMTALAGALGADYVAAANLGTLGHTMLLSFKVIEVRSASALVHAKETVQSKDELVHATEAVAAQTVAAIFGRGGSPASGPAPQPAPAPPPRVDLAPHPERPADAAPEAVTGVAPPHVSRSPTGHTLGVVATVLGAVALAAGTGLGVVAQQQTMAARNVTASSGVESRVNAVNGLVTGAVAGWAAGGALAVTGAGLLLAF